MVGKAILNSKIVQFQKPVYSFGVISDIHINRTNQDAEGDLRKAFSAFRNRGITRVFCCGDISTNHTEDELQTFAAVKNEFSEITFRSCTGNHDVQFTEQQWQTYIGHGFKNGSNDCMYTEEINGDVFCLLPIKAWEGAHPYSSGSDPHADFYYWFRNDLMVDGKRVFLFMHFPLNSESGSMQYPGLKVGQHYGFGSGSEDNSTIKEAVADALAREYCRNVTVFSGHSHYAFDVQGVTSDFKDIIFLQEDNFAHVHVPSLVVPRDQDMNVIHNGHPELQPAQGYVVDVYPDYVKLTGLEFNLKVLDADQRKGLVRIANRYIAECEGFKPIPNDYQPLEFVNVNGRTWSGDTKPLDNSAYINTGILPSTDLRVYTTVTLGNNPGEWQALIGSTSYAKYAWPLWSIRYSSNSIITDFTKPYDAQHSGFSVQISDKTDIQIEYDARRLSVNGVVQEDTSITDYTETGNYPIIIGGMYHWTSDVGARAGTIALYKRTKFVKISTGEVLGDFFPVKRKDTGVCGFFDIVKQQFHPSLNSIPFTENRF